MSMASEIDIGSWWTHVEGKSAPVSATSDSSVTLEGCGSWPSAEFLERWKPSAGAPHQSPKLIPDAPGKDNTEHAHPAWHRGAQYMKSRLLEEAIASLEYKALLAKYPGIDKDLAVYFSRVAGLVSELRAQLGGDR